MADIIVRQVRHSGEMELCASVIRDSFATLVENLNITRQNCPAHPSFITADELRCMREDGSVLFGLFDDSKQVGFVAVKDRGAGIFYLEKLAVLPEYRHKGYGRKLIDFVFDYVRSLGGSVVRLGTVEENALLKSWYLGYGFVETEVRQFERLPFAVCLMEKRVD